MTSRILIGDVREQLATLPDNSIQCAVTSPPYYGLRDYGVAGQIGLEPTLAEFIATLVDVFREVRRVLRPDGTCFVNMGDSYHTDSPVRRSSAEAFSKTWDATQTASRGGLRKSAAKSGTFKNKDLMMVPARLAIALCDDGWYLRSDIIWAKKAPMPESVTDRPTSAHEHIFLLTKQPRYFYDADAVAEPVADANAQRTTAHYNTAERYGANNGGNGGLDGLAARMRDGTHSTRNLRNVWTLGPESFAAAHFATFPTEIPRRCIKAGTSERGCCPACGSPWARITDRPKPPHVDPSEIDRFGTGDAGVHRKVGGQYQKWLDENPKQTVGWEPTCDCHKNAGASGGTGNPNVEALGGITPSILDPVPSTILDPFLGSGTTLLVADQLGRNGIGIELNPEYAALAKARITNDAPLFARVAD